MDAETRAAITAITGGVLGWALGSLIDSYLPKLKITKSKPILTLTVLGALALILSLRF